MKFRSVARASSPSTPSAIVKSTMSNPRFSKFRMAVEKTTSPHDRRNSSDRIRKPS